MSDLLNDTAARAQRYLDSIAARPVAPTDEALKRLDALREEFPEKPADPARVISLLDEIGSPATVATAGPRFFGLVVGGALPATVAASWLATTWDQEAGSSAISPIATILEDIAQSWLLDVLGLPRDATAAFVTGATMANFTALAAARHAVLKRVGWDVEADGLFGAPPVTVIVGDEVHPSVSKALGLLGFGRDRVVRVPADGQGRMRADLLPEISSPAIVCAQVGNVNTGASDPVSEICEHARESGAWVHVDGAFGLWAAAVPKLNHLVEGVEGADSWATDAHKWLNVPYDSGLAFVRDESALRSAMAVTAAYLPSTDVRQPDHYTPELSRRARGVEVWAALKSLGREGLIELIERTCRHAQRFAEGLQAGGYEILNDVVLNQVLVSFGDEAMTRRVVDALQSEGTCWCGGTIWQGRAAMRISVSSWATTEADVEQSLEAMLRVASEVRAV